MVNYFVLGSMATINKVLESVSLSVSVGQKFTLVSSIDTGSKGGHVERRVLVHGHKISREDEED